MHFGRIEAEVCLETHQMWAIVHKRKTVRRKKREEKKRCRPTATFCPYTIFLRLITIYRTLSTEKQCLKNITGQAVDGEGYENMECVNPNGKRSVFGPQSVFQ